MSTERKFAILAGLACIGVAIEGLISATRYAVATDPVAVVALVRALIAWWIGSIIAEALRRNLEK